ncbi:GlyGly-CTERM sorting domain-containing protein [Rhodoferax sp.]
MSWWTILFLMVCWRWHQPDL